MSGGINLGDLPSWMLVTLMGFGLKFLSSNGVLTGYEGLSELLIVCGLGLGVFYFATDISNKV